MFILKKCWYKKCGNKEFCSYNFNNLRYYPCFLSLSFNNIEIYDLKNIKLNTLQ